MPVINTDRYATNREEVCHVQSSVIINGFPVLVATAGGDIHGIGLRGRSRLGDQFCGLSSCAGGMSTEDGAGFA